MHVFGARFERLGWQWLLSGLIMVGAMWAVPSGAVWAAEDATDASAKAAVPDAEQHQHEDTSSVEIVRYAGADPSALAMDLLARVPRCADDAIRSIGLALADAPRPVRGVLHARICLIN